MVALVLGCWLISPSLGEHYRIQRWSIGVCLWKIQILYLELDLHLCSFQCLGAVMADVRVLQLRIKGWITESPV